MGLPSTFLGLGTLSAATVAALYNTFNNEANAYWYAETGELNTGHNNASDAFRHAYVAARFAQVFGYDMARALGDINEEFYPDPDPNETDMDRWNNMEGARIGSQYLFDPNASWLVADEIFQGLDSGRFAISPEDMQRIRDNFLIDPTIESDFLNGIQAFLSSFDEQERKVWGFLINTLPAINPLVNTYYLLASVFLNLRDPLALDLNGDGITTLSANEGILFDHNNSGIRYGTGWINPQDGWLALDRNGNGQIDSGRELFGDSTRKLDGNLAAHAYDALKSFDTNNDGKVDSADATGDTNTNGMIDGNETYWDINHNNEYDAGVDKVFSDLRVWVDANSNGETDSGELKTLGELNIVSISTGKTAVDVTDANGNINTFVGSYTKTTGEVVDGTRSFNLVQNTFHNAPSSSVNIPPGVAALPNVQGSGAVRDLHQAMSLGAAEFLAFKPVVDNGNYSGRPWVFC